jgi:hypothetical protein
LTTDLQGSDDTLQDVINRRCGEDMVRNQGLASQAVHCMVRTAGLLAGGQLHLRLSRVGSRVALPNGASFVVFRESYSDAPGAGTPVVLAVWFHLRAIPPGAEYRRWLFERLCILNTVLFAGFDGYLVKLWMVDPATSDYAGLYSWASAQSAERYGRYITAILQPLSSPRSVGFQVVPDSSFENYLRALSNSTSGP